MGDQTCTVKTFYFKPADGPMITWKGKQCVDKKNEKAEPEQKCWFEERSRSEYFKPADGPGYSILTVEKVRKCKVIEQKGETS